MGNFSRKKCLLLTLLLLALFSLAGCWSKKELNQLAIVLAVGIDPGTEKDYRVTVQIANPAGLSIAAAGGQGGGGGGQSAVVVKSREAETVIEAMRNFISGTGRKLFLSHNQLLIFGEKAAQNGLFSVLDFFERDHESRGNAYVLVAKGEAKGILEIPGQLEKSSAMEITESLQAATHLSKAEKITLHDFLMRFSSEATCAVIPRIEVVEGHGKDKFRISGMAFFKKDKLAGWLNEQAARGLMWADGRVKSGIVVIETPGRKKGNISIEIVHAKAKKRATVRTGRPEITLLVEVDGNIGELSTPVELSKKEVLAAAEQEFAEAVAAEINAALQVMRESSADFFGFGEEIHRSAPVYWAGIKDKWEYELPTLDVKVEVKSKIRRIGDKVISVTPK